MSSELAKKVATSVRRSIAVCCGFNSYVEHGLRCAQNDATRLYTKLIENRAFNSDPHLTGAGRVFTQKVTEATEILAAFASAANSAADLVWFSFSGHAVVSNTGELRLLLPQWRSTDSEHEKRKFSIGANDLEAVLRPYLRNRSGVRKPGSSRSVVSS